MWERSPEKGALDGRIAPARGRARVRRGRAGGGNEKMSGVQRVGGRGNVDFGQADSVDSSQSAQSAGTARSTSAAQKGTHLPGEIATKSGQYCLVDSSGKHVGKEKTITKGEPFPPARPGLAYKLVDATKHSDETGVG